MPSLAVRTCTTGEYTGQLLHHRLQASDLLSGELYTATVRLETPPEPTAAALLHPVVVQQVLPQDSSDLLFLRLVDEHACEIGRLAAVMSNGLLSWLMYSKHEQYPYRSPPPDEGYLQNCFSPTSVVAALAPPVLKTFELAAANYSY